MCREVAWLELALSGNAHWSGSKMDARSQKEAFGRAPSAFFYAIGKSAVRGRRFEEEDSALWERIEIRIHTFFFEKIVV